MAGRTVAPEAGLLGTKLHVPLPRRELVPRPRLTELLRVDESRMPRLVVVSAPAGFGKTTLMTQWLASNSCRVAWLSLDPMDSDLRRFLTHLVAALQTQAIGVGAEALALLDTDRAPPTQSILVSLINNLDQLPGSTVLALDDYHVVEALEVHEALTYLLDHLPPRVTIAISVTGSSWIIWWRRYCVANPTTSAASSSPPPCCMS